VDADRREVLGHQQVGESSAARDRLHKYDHLDNTNTRMIVWDNMMATNSTSTCQIPTLHKHPDVRMG